MKKIAIILISIFLPAISYAAFGAGWETPSTTAGFITPNLINGVVQSLHLGQATTSLRQGGIDFYYSSTSPTYSDPKGMWLLGSDQSNYSQLQIYNPFVNKDNWTTAKGATSIAFCDNGCYELSSTTINDQAQLSYFTHNATPPNSYYAFILGSGQLGWPGSDFILGCSWYAANINTGAMGSTSPSGCISVNGKNGDTGFGSVGNLAPQGDPESQYQIDIDSRQGSGIDIGHSPGGWSNGVFDTSTTTGSGAWNITDTGIINTTGILDDFDANLNISTPNNDNNTLPIGHDINITAGRDGHFATNDGNVNISTTGGGAGNGKISLIDNAGGGIFLTGNITTPITGSTQCLQVTTAGLLQGSGSGCGGTNYWTANGNNIYNNNNSGKGYVGIGSSTPSARLAVQASSTLAISSPIFAIASSSVANTATTTLFKVLGSGETDITATGTGAGLVVGSGPQFSGFAGQGAATVQVVAATGTAAIVGMYRSSINDFAYLAFGTNASSVGTYFFELPGNSNNFILNHGGVDPISINGTTNAFSSIRSVIDDGTGSTSLDNALQINFNGNHAGNFDIYDVGAQGDGSGDFFSLDGTNDHITTGGGTPGISGGTSSVAGNDNNGTITVTGTLLTSVTMTFAKTWGTAPDCTISDSSTGLTAAITTLSATQMVVGFSAGVNSGKVYYSCRGHF